MLFSFRRFAKYKLRALSNAQTPTPLVTPLARKGAIDRRTGQSAMETTGEVIHPDGTVSGTDFARDSDYVDGLRNFSGLPQLDLCQNPIISLSSEKNSPAFGSNPSNTEQLVPCVFESPLPVPTALESSSRPGSASFLPLGRTLMGDFVRDLGSARGTPRRGGVSGTLFPIHSARGSSQSVELKLSMPIDGGEETTTQRLHKQKSKSSIDREVSGSLSARIRRGADLLEESFESSSNEDENSDNDLDLSAASGDCDFLSDPNAHQGTKKDGFDSDPLLICDPSNVYRSIEHKSSLASSQNSGKSSEAFETDSDFSIHTSDGSSFASIPVPILKSDQTLCSLHSDVGSRCSPSHSIDPEESDWESDFELDSPSERDSQRPVADRIFVPPALLPNGDSKNWDAVRSEARSAYEGQVAKLGGFRPSLVVSVKPSSVPPNSSVIHKQTPSSAISEIKKPFPVSVPTTLVRSSSVIKASKEEEEGMDVSKSLDMLTSSPEPIVCESPVLESEGPLAESEDDLASLSRSVSLALELTGGSLSRFEADFRNSGKLQFTQNSSRIDGTASSLDHDRFNRYESSEMNVVEEEMDTSLKFTSPLEAYNACRALRPLYTSSPLHASVVLLLMTLLIDGSSSELASSSLDSGYSQQFPEDVGGLTSAGDER